MCKDKKAFVQYTQFTQPTLITVGNSSTLMAVGKGSINFVSKVDHNLEIELILTEVLYVPGLA